MSKADARERPADSPQMRRRSSLARKTEFSVAKAGPEAIHRFGIQQRLGFLSLVLTALACMVAAALLVDRAGPELVWGLAGGGLLLLGASSFIDKRWWVLRFFLALIGLAAGGAGLGLGLPRGPESLALLLNPATLIGITLFGASINGLWLGADRSPAFEFLAAGPWLALACGVAWLFPAGELVMGISGAVALLLLYCLVRAIREAPPRFQPGQSLAAAAHVFPLAGAATFRWLLR